MLSSTGWVGGADVRSRLSRIVDRAPEVMVKVTGRTRDAGHLAAHLAYIARHGALEAEDRDGNLLQGRAAIRELAEDWSAAALADSRRRANSPFSVSIVLSMPARTDPFALRDAARALHETRSGIASTTSSSFTPTPTIRMSTWRSVRWAIAASASIPRKPISRPGGRVSPGRSASAGWWWGGSPKARPRRTRKPERSALRKLRERHEAGRGAIGRIRRAAFSEAARAAFQGEVGRTPWEQRIIERQARVRGLYLAQAKLLSTSADPVDRSLGLKVEAFVRGMPAPDTQRLALARELRAASAAQRARLGSQDRRPRDDGRQRDRE